MYSESASNSGSPAKFAVHVDSAPASPEARPRPAVPPITDSLV